MSRLIFGMILVALANSQPAFSQGENTEDSGIEAESGQTEAQTAQVAKIAAYQAAWAQARETDAEIQQLKADRHKLEKQWIPYDEGRVASMPKADQIKWDEKSGEPKPQSQEEVMSHIERNKADLVAITADNGVLAQARQKWKSVDNAWMKERVAMLGKLEKSSPKVREAAKADRVAIDWALYGIQKAKLNDKFDELKLAAIDEKAALKALKLRFKNTALGKYVKAAQARTLSSEGFCDKAKACLSK